VIKLTVNITEQAEKAMHAIAARRGISRTDAINQALAAYSALLDAPLGLVLDIHDGTGDPIISVAVVSPNGEPS